MPLYALDIAFQTVSNEKCLAIASSKTAIRQIHPLCPGYNPRFRCSVRIDNKHRTKTWVADEQATFFIHGKTVGAGCSKTLEK
jgi:hypothetical protein